jgi:hypothetical protein
MPRNATPQSDRAGEESVDEAALAQALGDVPRGALALCGLAVAFLVLGYVYVYMFVFLPRGMVS